MLTPRDVRRCGFPVDGVWLPAAAKSAAIITSNITILAYGATLRRAGFSVPTFRLFAVGGTGHLTIRRAYIRGFLAQGGNSDGGGGGGMGAYGSGGLGP